MNHLIKHLRCFQFAQTSKSIAPIIAQTSTGKDKYRKYHKIGPQLFLTHILMVNGPLTSKELWKIYEKKLHEEKLKGGSPDFQYWPSLTKMKETIKYMRLNQKIKSNGYSYKTHHFNGWKIQEKRALKFVHPTVINEIQGEISARENL